MRHTTNNTWMMVSQAKEKKSVLFVVRDLKAVSVLVGETVLIVLSTCVTSCCKACVFSRKLRTSDAWAYFTRRNEGQFHALSPTRSHFITT